MPEEKPGLYSTFVGFRPKRHEQLFGPRRRINAVAIIVAILVPWVVFCVNFAILSFSFHFERPVLSSLVVFLLLGLVLLVGLAAVRSLRRRPAETAEPSWYLFVFVTGLLAWTSSALLGKLNFAANLEEFYDFQTLNTYPNIDPRVARGSQLMDAGRVVFVDNARVDVSRSMSFRKGDTFCVAPITVGGDGKEASPKMQRYDFWAVGTNCCGASAEDFRCGEAANPRGHAGLRLLDDAPRPFYRLAVQQAEAAYKIEAPHPIFLRYVQDPFAELSHKVDQGFQNFVLAIFSHLGLQAFLVICAALAFAKVGTR